MQGLRTETANSMESEKSKIWKEIKSFASAINKAGGNTVGLLLWSRGKSLEEVQKEIEIIIAGHGGMIGTSRGNSDPSSVNNNNEPDEKKLVIEGGEKAAKEKEEKMVLCLAEQQRLEGSQYSIGGSGNS